MRSHPKIFLSLFVAILLITPLAQSAKDSEIEFCQSTREFVTVLEYLRSNSSYGLSENQSRKIAHQVSQGCTNSAKRFIKGYELIYKIELGGQTALRVGLALSNATDEIADNFIRVFKKSYLSSELDLDAKTAVAVAQKLSYDFKGNFEAARDDFYSLVDFCRGSILKLPASRCAQFAVNLIKRSEEFQEPIAKLFQKTFKYLTENRNIGLSVSEAFKKSQDILASGPQSLDNFVLAYDYALNKKGLNYSAQNAFEFAMKMSQRSIDMRVDSPMADIK